MQAHRPEYPLTIHSSRLLAHGHLRFSFSSALCKDIQYFIDIKNRSFYTHPSHDKRSVKLNSVIQHDRDGYVLITFCAGMH